MLENDYEYAILACQEGEFDMCSSCEFAGIDTLLHLNNTEMRLTKCIK